MHTSLFPETGWSITARQLVLWRAVIGLGNLEKFSSHQSQETTGNLQQWAVPISSTIRPHLILPLSCRPLSNFGYIILRLWLRLYGIADMLLGEPKGHWSPRFWGLRKRRLRFQPTSGSYVWSIESHASVRTNLVRRKLGCLHFWDQYFKNNGWKGKKVIVIKGHVLYVPNVTESRNFTFIHFKICKLMNIIFS